MMQDSRVGGVVQPAVARDYLEPLVVGLLAVAALMAHLSAPAFHPGGFLLDCATLVAAGLTGRWPRAAGVALAGLLIVSIAFVEWPTLGEYAPLIVVFCLGVRGRFKHRRWLSAIFLLELWALTGAAALGESPLRYMTVWAVFMLAAWLAGSAWHALIVARDESGARASLEERHALARELHDSVADAMSSVSLRAERAKLAGVADAAELGAIADDAARAMREFGHIVNVLRRPSDEPATEAVELAALVEAAETRLQRRGFHPRVSWEGTSPALPAKLGHILGRVIEEATNNMIRHGDPSRHCAIVVDVSSETVELAFLNHVRKRTVGEQVEKRPGARPNPGFGRVSMLERVAALNGTMSSAREGETWLTGVRIPLRPVGSEPRP